MKIVKIYNDTGSRHGKRSLSYKKIQIEKGVSKTRGRGRGRGRGRDRNRGRGRGRGLFFFTYFFMSVFLSFNLNSDFLQFASALYRYNFFRCNENKY